MVSISSITKPTYADNVVDRPRLYQHLDGWQAVHAVVIHAPAGYGKSSLVSRWIDQRGLANCTAWLALEADDNDPHFFVEHLAAALACVLPGAPTLIEPILRSSRSPVERALERLCTALHEDTDQQPILLVFDDLHEIEAPAVHTLITSCLNHGPANLHFMLLARRRTALPLARLYAHGKVIALTIEDLRFREPEVDAYLQRRGFPPPSEVDVAELTVRSEGWITALQLSVLTLRERRSAHDLLSVTHGAGTWLADFLIDEVLDRQPPDLRAFLLQTSLLDTFNAELCGAVTGVDDAYGKVAALVRAGLFVTPLEENGWFRYHQLFQELLQHHLRAETPVRNIAELHRRAAAWLASAGQVHSAVRHLLAASATDEAAALVEAQMGAKLLRDPYHARSLLALLPEAVLQQRPQLMIDRCRLAALFDDNRALVYAQAARTTLQTQPLAQALVTRYHAELLVLETGAHFLLHDLAAACDAERQAQALRPNLDDFYCGALDFMSMHLHSYAGRRAEMALAAEAALAAFERTGYAAGIIALRRQMARWSVVGGNSREANRRFRELLDDRDLDWVSNAHELAWAYSLAAENSYLQNQLEQALAYQRSCMELAIQLQDQELIDVARYLGLVMGRDVTVVDMDAQTFVAHLAQNTSLAAALPILDWVTGVLIACGRSELAWQIVRAYGIDLQSIPIDHVHRRLIVYLRTRIAVGVDLEALTPVLAAALAMATEHSDRLYQLQLLTLTAWHQLQLPGGEAARATLGAAARLARETGYVRVILDIPVVTQWVQQMKIVLDPVPRAAALNGVGTLTAQELCVLKLLAADRTYDQIGAELVLSIGTVRTHVVHIYRKLAVHRRDQAIAAAQGRGLLAA